MKEPVAVPAGIVALIVGFLTARGIYWLDSATVTALINAALILGAAWFGRQKSMPVATIKEAGLKPEAIKRDAEDPMVRPVA